MKFPKREDETKTAANGKIFHNKPYKLCSSDATVRGKHSTVAEPRILKIKGIEKDSRFL